MELPKFKYSPNAYGLDIFEKAEGTCSVCNEKRQMKYTGSFYSTEDPEYICPWCIANGKLLKNMMGNLMTTVELKGFHLIQMIRHRRFQKSCCLKLQTGHRVILPGSRKSG